MALRISEAITVLYVLYLAGDAWARPVSPVRRRRVLVTAIIVVAVVIFFARYGRG